MPWCQLLIDDPGGEDERSFKRLMHKVPTRGELIEVDGETVRVTSVSLIPPRTKAVESLSVLVYCRPF
jgi:hypothetical protein